MEEYHMCNSIVDCAPIVKKSDLAKQPINITNLIQNWPNFM